MRKTKYFNPHTEVGQKEVEDIYEVMSPRAKADLDKVLFVPKSDTPPPLTELEQWNARVYLAINHEDSGKCHIYGDDGELQCGNVARHGRSIDFRREPFSDLLNIVQETRMKEYQIAQGNFSWEQVTPAQIVAGMEKLASDIRKGKTGTVVI
jgi:hypothetical protein